MSLRHDIHSAQNTTHSYFAWEEPEWEAVVNGCSVSICEDLNILEMDGGNGYTTQWMYSVPLNCTFINGPNGIFCVYFTTIKKRRPGKRDQFTRGKKTTNRNEPWQDPDVGICWQTFWSSFVIVIGPIKENIHNEWKDKNSQRRNRNYKKELNGSSRTEKSSIWKINILSILSIYIFSDILIFWGGCTDIELLHLVLVFNCYIKTV